MSSKSLFASISSRSRNRPLSGAARVHSKINDASKRNEEEIGIPPDMQQYIRRAYQSCNTVEERDAMEKALYSTLSNVDAAPRSDWPAQTIPYISRTKQDHEDDGDDLDKYMVASKDERPQRKQKGAQTSASDDDVDDDLQEYMVSRSAPSQSGEDDLEAFLVRADPDDDLEAYEVAPRKQRPPEPAEDLAEYLVEAASSGSAAALDEAVDVDDVSEYRVAPAEVDSGDELAEYRAKPVSKRASRDQGGVSPRVARRRESKRHRTVQPRRVVVEEDDEEDSSCSSSSAVGSFDIITSNDLEPLKASAPTWLKRAVADGGIFLYKLKDSNGQPFWPSRLGSKKDLNKFGGKHLSARDKQVWIYTFGDNMSTWCRYEDLHEYPEAEGVLESQEVMRKDKRHFKASVVEAREFRIASKAGFKTQAHRGSRKRDSERQKKRSVGCSSDTERELVTTKFLADELYAYSCQLQKRLDKAVASHSAIKRKISKLETQQHDK